MIPIMTYTFDTLLASKYGVNEAIMLNNFIYWIAKNEANGKHFYDGRYWTYNSVVAMEKLYPFWTTSQIRTIIASLVRQGVLLKGNYNEKPYDRTVWYALTDEFRKCICQISQMDLSDFANGIVENGKPIPDIKPSAKNTDIKQADNAHTRVAKNISNRFSFRDALIVAGASEPCVDKLMEIRKRKRLNNSEHASRQLIAAITTICNTRGVTVDDVLRFMDTQDWGAIRPDWGGVEHIRSSVPRGGKMLSFEELMNRDRNRYASQ